MCRLFGSLATDPVQVEDWLLDAPIPFVRQANIDPDHLQGEGWGIAWFSNGNERVPRVVRGLGAVYEPEQLAAFTRTARSVRAPLVIAHLRKASNPLGLPRDRLVGELNTQPFLSDGTIFAHNGWIAHPEETRARLGDRASKVRGINDSEVLQQLFLHHVDRGLSPREAFPLVVSDLIDVWNDVGAPRRGPFGGLNFLYAPSTSELWAFCFYAGEHGSCLSGLPRPYYEMSYRLRDGRLVITSEPMDRDLAAWTPIPSGTFLRAQARPGGVEVTSGQVPDLAAYPLAEGPGPEPGDPPVPV